MRKYLTPEIMHDSPLRDSKVADFHFDDFAATLARLIASRKTQTPLAIGINGAWGSGKTSLLLRVKNMLDKPNGENGRDEHRYAKGEENDFYTCKTVWFDAWKYNDEDTLLVALVRVVLQAMQRGTLKEKFKAWLENPMENSYDLPAMFVNAFEAKFGGLGAELKVNFDPKKHETISPFETHAAFFDYFNEAFDRLLEAWLDRDGVMVIFIDDLDRCLPAKTVQTLEAIKLFLDKSGCVFMLGADTRIVQMAVETHYKNAGITGESAKDYLEKVIQLRFDLPQILDDAMEKFLIQQSEVDESMRKRWRALVAAAEVNPRRVKNVINDLNLQWSMAVNSGQADESNRDNFICWQALMHAAPASFVRQVTDFEDRQIRFNFIQDALKWQNGKQEEKDAVKGFFSAYEDRDARRLRGVLKQISFSADFSPEALESIIYLSAPPAKPVVEEPVQAALLDVKLEDVTLEGVVTREKGETARPALERTPSRDGNHLLIGGMEFMRIPAGKFIMGSKDDNEFNQDDERPQHTVDLNYNYWIAKFILTNQMFAEFIKSTNYTTTAEKEGGYSPKESKFVKGIDWKHPTAPIEKWEDKVDHPVVQVSWDDATAYCKWFNENFKSELGDLLLRLPTEAEWEKAARGAYANEWPWGNEFDSKKCNSNEGGKGGTTPVGVYSILGGDSPYGCADMVGNVWEWTHSRFVKYPYIAKDGREDEASRDSRVLRGGSFSHFRYLDRCACRNLSVPDYRYHGIGFRVCVSPITSL
jgi:formylglycine-generating enzyme required for sulfatase activity